MPPPLPPSPARPTGKPICFTTSMSQDGALPHPPREAGEGERLRMESDMR